MRDLDQITTRSATMSVPLVSGLTSRAMMKLVAPTSVPTSIGGGHNWKGGGVVEGTTSLDVMQLARADYLSGPRHARQ
jgi:hypothetical protein